MSGEHIGITGYDSYHYVVENLDRSRKFYTERFDFKEVARAGDDLVSRGGQQSVVLGAGDVRVCVSTPLRQPSKAARYLERHPAGVMSLSFRVEDLDHTMAFLDKRGGTFLADPLEDKDEKGGTYRSFEIATPLGDVAFRFVERKNYARFAPGFTDVGAGNGSNPPNLYGINRVDHVTSNGLTMQPIIAWYRDVLGMEPFWDISFHTQDVAKQRVSGSGLRSIVMWDPKSGVKFATNEPLRPHFRDSQIAKFVDDNRGPGVQHIAFAVDDILWSVEELKRRGVEFMDTPKAYYLALPERLAALGISNVKEEIAELERLQILVDGAHDKYMLQIFLREAAAMYDEVRAGPFFYEVIQRCGDEGFGYGNFRALFESIERSPEGVRTDEVRQMIDRMSCGLMPAKPHTVLRDANGNLLYEEMYTRGGFSGAFTYFYHRHAPTPAVVESTTRGHVVPVADEAGRRPLKRRLYDTRKMTPSGSMFEDRVPLLFNKDVAIYCACPAKSDDVYFANGDGDELWFVQEGSARLESVCGWLPVGPGDYVWIPKSMIHRWHVGAGPGSSRPQQDLGPGSPRPQEDLGPGSPRPQEDLGPLRMMCFEGSGGVMIPKDFRNPVGQLKMDAPYTHRDFVRPEGPIATPDRLPEGPNELFVKKNGAFSRLVLERSPMDVVGWDGFAYPWAFNIEKYQPKTGLVHLPPTIHSTFAGPGFLVCSFVPRVTDTHPQAIPCPYPHSSVDCDEVILYLRGNFTSRRGIGPGAISLHPAGVVHGPHPGAYEASIGSTRTDELAVMIDTYVALAPTTQAANLEDTGYHDSWRTPPKA